MAIARLVLTGNLGRDPELKEVGDSHVCDFSIPVTTHKRGDKTTGWLNVSVWGRQAESCAEYLSKGSPVTVDGELQVRQYEKDGATVTVWEIRASNVQFGPRTEPKAEAPDAPAADDDDDIQF